MLSKTIDYAKNAHKKVNHKYDDEDYSFHLEMVQNASIMFIYLVDISEKENVYCGCWVHDIIEDARETYNDVKKNTNETIAELAFALTNEKGKVRSERANDKYYAEMHKVPNAVFIKFCDRIANVIYSKKYSPEMFKKYQKENENFIKKLYRPELEDMITYINEIIK